jgi:hypothetical protein
VAKKAGRATAWMSFIWVLFWVLVLVFRPSYFRNHEFWTFSWVRTFSWPTYLVSFFPPLLMSVVTLRSYAKLPDANGTVHCKSCGYDLRGNQTGICPECGTAIPPNKRAPNT